MSYLDLAKQAEARLKGTTSATHTASGVAADRQTSSTDESTREISEGSEETSGGRPARVLLDWLLGQGATLEIIRDGGKDVLLWFGPASTVTLEMRAQITRQKPALIWLLRNGHQKSRRTWGEPGSADWQEHPQPREDCE